MAESAFASTAPNLAAQGYSPLPIEPGQKRPGSRLPNGLWRPLAHWDRWCKERPSPYLITAWTRMIGSDSGAGVGVACGLGLICIDIDQEACMAALLNILPPSNVQKKGRKGISLFYRGNTDKIRSKNFRTLDRVGLVDLLAEGKQTVLPPSIHPDTGEPYFWWTDSTLEDTPLDQLAELPDDIAEQIAEVLKNFGYDPNHERAHSGSDSPLSTASPRAGVLGLYRETNDRAMANFEAWVPKLGLYKSRRKPGGFEAVATWRDSSTGRPPEVRKRNLSIARAGIVDFGSGDTYTPVDLVMAARGIDKSAALNWLLEQLPQDEPLILFRK